MIPDEGQAIALHTKHGSNEHILRHCRACARVSMSLGARAIMHDNPVDEKAVFAGALLHDIGRSRTQTVEHGVVGARLLELEGIDPIVVEIVRRHVGAGISSAEAVTLGFPSGDYVPRTLEQKIVCFVDKMLDGDRVRPLGEEVKRFVRRGHDVERLLRLRDDVTRAVGEDAEKLALSG